MDLTNKVDDFRTAFHIIKKEADDLSTQEVKDRLNELDEDIAAFNKRLREDYRSAAFQERIDELSHLRDQVIEFKMEVLAERSL